MRDVALGCEGIGGVWLVSNEGCAPGVISLISVVNACGGYGQKKLKRLMQAKRDMSGASEWDYLMRVMFRLPEGCEVWLVPKTGPITREATAEMPVAKEQRVDAVESALVG